MICNLCPRNCNASRTEDSGGGFCGMPLTPIVAKSMLHAWEEPCLTGDNGAGAVFFAGCSLGCVYCQNHAISNPGMRTWKRRAISRSGEASPDWKAPLLLSLPAVKSVM